MKKLSKIKDWFEARLASGEAWDFFLIGVIAVSSLTVLSIIIGYVTA